MKAAVLIDPDKKQIRVVKNLSGLKAAKFMPEAIGAEVVDKQPLFNDYVLYLDFDAVEKFRARQTKCFNIRKIGTLIGKALLVKEVDGEVTEYEHEKVAGYMKSMVKWGAKR